MAWQKNFDPIKYKKSQIILSFVLFATLAIIGIFLWRVFYPEETVIQTTPIISSEESPEAVDEIIVEEPMFNATAINDALQAWGQSVDGQASVVIANGSDGAVLAVLNPDDPYFAASIYKLYVAHEGYRQIDNGVVAAEEPYLAGFSRAECLDKMIRESDSPCAEKLWVELGKQETTDILRTYGLQNTSMTAITTTAADAAVMLDMIASGDSISDESRQLFLESMRTQIYRDTLNKSFPESEGYTVYNKIGFRELDEYHDVALVSLPDGRSVIISVLTSNVGTINIIELGNQLKAVL